LASILAGPFTIAFEFPLEATKLAVPLTATVEDHHLKTYFIVKGFHSSYNHKEPILPPISIKKAKGIWVHIDSGKESILSQVVEKAIETITK
jgi:hypothetical protein